MGSKPMTLADHQASPMIADPFRLFDCCLENDGACAVVVTTLERARDSAKGGVEILSSAQGAVQGYGWGPFATHDIPDESYASGGGAGVARRLWARAGLGPADVDVAQLYDHFSGLVLLTLEDFGFCARGESGAFVESGALAWPDGALPANTHGGSLSEAYIHGLNHVVEGVRQLRGESTCQVDGATVCLVTSAAGVPTSALLLGRR
jgi:acetyl-CoA acetyltransferase